MRVITNFECGLYFTMAYPSANFQLNQCIPNTSVKLASGSRFIIHGSGFSVWFRIKGIIQNTTNSVWCRIKPIIKKMPRVFFSVWFRIQGIIKKCQGDYSASGSVFRILFKIPPVASASEFSVLLKMSTVLISVWFTIQRIFRVLFKIRTAYYLAPGSEFRVLFINVQGYYSASSSEFKILFKIPPAAFGSGFSVLLKNVHGINQRLVQDSAYFSGYYSKYE